MIDIKRLKKIVISLYAHADVPGKNDFTKRLYQDTMPNEIKPARSGNSQVFVLPYQKTSRLRRPRDRVTKCKTLCVDDMGDLAFGQLRIR